MLLLFEGESLVGTWVKKINTFIVVQRAGNNNNSLDLILIETVICCRPYQHGADMLAAISQVLNECTKPDQATPAALVLQGLHALCQAEVGISEWFCITRKLFYKTVRSDLGKW